MHRSFSKNIKTPSITFYIHASLSCPPSHKPPHIVSTVIMFIYLSPQIYLAVRCAVGATRAHYTCSKSVMMSYKWERDYLLLLGSKASRYHFRLVAVLCLDSDLHPNPVQIFTPYYYICVYDYTEHHINVAETLMFHKHPGIVQCHHLSAAISRFDLDG